jgi:hypothetical protein
MKSNYFWNSTLKGLSRVGDVYIPQTGEFPSFSQLGCIEMIDEMAAYLPGEDVSLLNGVLTVFAVLPVRTLRWLVRVMEESLDNVGTLPSLLRLLSLGLRGLLFGCYYSGYCGQGYTGKTPLDILGYQLNRVLDEPVPASHEFVKDLA